MALIALIALAFALVVFPTFRCALFHPVPLVVYGVRDLINYFRHKEYNNYATGELVAYTGLFGKGKTLSVVHRVVSAYHKYDGKSVWCRHYYISLYYTAQRFGHVDALLRQVTSYVMDCDKLWRFQRLNQYDAWDMENASNTQLIAPMGRACWFVHDRDYEAYNTLACVGNLKKSMQEGDMMSEDEILRLQQNSHQGNMDVVSKPSRKWMRSRKKQHGK